MTERRRLLAGSWGPERMPARLDRDDADWFLPLHVRDEVGARERIASQVVVGADVVVAPTWLTHRPALLPLGETRRAATWTAAAVRLARDAVEVGLERREEHLAEVPDDDVRQGRPTPLIAASLPALDEEPEPGSGRLLPREAATERDYRDQAGVLADAEPDLLLVEGQRSEAEARVAITEAIDTGLPVWAAIHSDAFVTADPMAWLDWAAASSVACLLLPDLDAAAIAADGGSPWGGSVRPAEGVPDWLDAGAGVIARLDGATVAALEPLRTGIDEFERAEIETQHDSRDRWHDHLRRAAAMAPGGAAVWVGGTPTTPLPGGFEWLIVRAEETRRLPRDHYRFVVADEAIAEPGRLLGQGGVLVARLTGAPQHLSRLRLLAHDDAAEPPLATYRRED